MPMLDGKTTRARKAPLSMELPQCRSREKPSKKEEEKAEEGGEKEQTIKHLGLLMLREKTSREKKKGKVGGVKPSGKENEEKNKAVSSKA